MANQSSPERVGFVQRLSHSRQGRLNLKAQPREQVNELFWGHCRLDLAVLESAVCDYVFRLFYSVRKDQRDRGGLAFSSYLTLNP